MLLYWVSATLVVISVFFLPLKIEQLSDFLLWTLFYFVYLPSMLTVSLQDIEANVAWSVVVCMAVSFCAMALIGRFHIKIPAISFSWPLFCLFFFGVYLLLSAYVLSVYGGNLRLVQLSEVYDQRDLSENVVAGSLVGYATGLLSGAFNPFLMAVGIARRRWSWYFLGAAGQLFMYSTAALKSVLLSAILIPLFYFFLLRRRTITASRLGLLVIGSYLVPMAVVPFLGTDSAGLGWQLASLILMRTYGMSGMLTGGYADFFSTHEHTYYSHINIVSVFLSYPFDHSIGEEVGAFWLGRTVNANANFWASDGIAALGGGGIIIIGIVVGCFMAASNGFVKSVPTKLACAAFVPFLVSISNSSFFTSLLTGGGAALMLLIYIWSCTVDAASQSRASEMK
jgi:hypothetical protein